LRVIGTGGDSAAMAAAAGPAAAGIQAAVLAAPEEALPHLRASIMVKAAFRDLPVRAQQTSCVMLRDLSAGVSAVPSSSFRWQGCLTANARLVWTGVACPTNAGRISYNQVRAVNRYTNRPIMLNGKPCMLSPNSTLPAWTRQRFGGCGIAPTYAPSLPTRLCSQTGGDTPSSSPTPSASPPPPSPSPSTSPPPPERTGPVLPRDPLQPGETPPNGVKRIEAVIGDTVDRTSGLPVAQQVVVGIVDSGIDSTHADLNYEGGASWVTDSLNLPDESGDAGVDVYGHGTHVAGIVGARNTGQGVIGVAPGVPVYSLKVLDGEGRGSLSSVLDAIKWAAGPNGQAKGIRVINLSLTSYIDPSSTDFQVVVDSVCSILMEASNTGLGIVAAAGNYGTSMRGYLPASCPSVMAVTSMDPATNMPSSFSNWLPTDASPADLASVIAAPGSSIRSTISYTRDASGYRQLSGTSMAAPHVAGVAAACVMSGACAGAGSGIAKLGVVKAAAEEREGMPDGSMYSFESVPGKHYGKLVWAKY
jgi:subtilisin